MRIDLNPRTSPWPAAALLVLVLATHIGWLAFADRAGGFYMLRGLEGAVLFAMQAPRGNAAWGIVCLLGILAEGSDAACVQLPVGPGSVGDVLCDRATGLPVSMFFGWATLLAGWAVAQTLRTWRQQQRERASSHDAQ